MLHRWFIPLLVAVVAFIAGRWSNPAQSPAASRDTNESKSSKTGSRPSDDSTPSSKSSQRLEAGSKQPARTATQPPFQPGHARDWIDAQIKRGGWKDDPAVLFRMVQNFSAMDEEEISEVISSYQQIILARKDASPAELAAYPKEWLFKLGLFPAIWRYSQLNPDAAMDLVEKSGVPGIDELSQVVLANMATTDADRALARTTGLEGNDLRQAMEPILGTLFATDPDRVIGILENYPDPVFDGERRKVAERLAAKNPQKAIDYAITTIRAGRNPDVLKTAVNTWLQYHPEEARRWIETYTGPGHETLK